MVRLGRMRGVGSLSLAMAMAGLAWAALAPLLFKTKAPQLAEQVRAVAVAGARPLANPTIHKPALATHNSAAAVCGVC